MPQFFNNVFSKYQFGFQRSLSAKQYFSAMLEKWKKYVDNGKAFGALLTE